MPGRRRSAPGYASSSASWTPRSTDYRQGHARPAPLRGLDLGAARAWKSSDPLHLSLAVVGAAATDLAEAEAVCSSTTARPPAARPRVRQLGFFNSRRGDVPAALRAFDEAEASHQRSAITRAPCSSTVPTCCCPSGWSPRRGKRDPAAVEEFGLDSIATSALPQAQLLLAETSLLSGAAIPRWPLRMPRSSASAASAAPSGSRSPALRCCAANWPQPRAESRPLAPWPT